MKAFKKVKIAAGATTDVVLNVPVKNLAYYDIATGKWVVEGGKYELLVGTSSRDIKQRVSISIQ